MNCNTAFTKICFFSLNIDFLNFRLPDDIWLIDLDSNKLTPPTGNDQELPNLPEPEGTILKNHLKQVMEIFIAVYAN